MPVHSLSGFDRNNLYAFFGYDTQKVEEFTDYIIRLIKKGNAEELAQSVTYLLNVNINNDILTIDNDFNKNPYNIEKG